MASLERKTEKMKAKEIRELTLQEVEKKLRDAGQELVNLRLRKQAGQVEDSSLLNSLRKDIARLKTIRAEKAIA